MGRDGAHNFQSQDKQPLFAQSQILLYESTRCISMQLTILRALPLYPSIIFLREVKLQNVIYCLAAYKYNFLKLSWFKPVQQNIVYRHLLK